MRASHPRSPSTDAHRERLIAGLTKIRSTRGSVAAARSSATCLSVHTEGSVVEPSASTIGIADSDSRSAALNDPGGAKRNQMSTSRPVWWLRWPEVMGPPRGCARSPISSPSVPSAPAWTARSWTKAISTGWPKKRFRDGRITW
jgi:hypothetical protein